MKKEILDNELIAKEFIYQDDLTIIERLKSMLLDHAIICFTVLPVFMIPFIIGMETELKWLSAGIILLDFGIYLNKDSLGGRSAAKRILGQVVLNIETGKPAKELKCVIRNFTIIFWIFEVVIILFSPSRRFGDLIAGTKIVRTEKEDVSTILKDFKQADKTNLLLPFGMAVFFIWIVFYSSSIFSIF